MNISRKSIAAGLTVGALAGGAAGAVAATTSGSRASRTTSMAPDSSDRYGHGSGGGGTAWQAPATGLDWGARHGEPAGGVSLGW